jgi:hypothetical protein
MDISELIDVVVAFFQKMKVVLAFFR